MLLVGWQEGHLVCKELWVVGCWHGYLSGARCRLAYGPADATATHCSKTQIGFTFLVPAHPGSPRQRAIKQVLLLYFLVNIQRLIGVGSGGDRTAPGEELPVGRLTELARRTDRRLSVWVLYSMMVPVGCLTELARRTDRRLSVWVLYSMMVLGGRFRTRFSVSRMRDVVVWSSAVRFHNDRMSSCIAQQQTAAHPEICVGVGGHPLSPPLRSRAPLNQLGDLGSAVSSPSRIQGRKRIWNTLNLRESHWWQSF